MSSDCSHKEFVIWRMIPTGCNDIKKFRAPVRDMTFFKSLNTERVWSLYLLKGWDCEDNTIGFIMAFRLMGQQCLQCLRWSDYVADSVDVQYIILSVQCYTANLLLWILSRPSWPQTLHPIIQLYWLCTEVHHKLAQCLDRVMPQSLAK